MTGHKQIWDGIEPRWLPTEEADKEIAADRAQDLSVFHAVHEIKHRHEFTGYMTRELRAGVPPTPVIPDAVDAAVERDADNVSAGDEAALDWQDYKAKYKKATGKKRANKAQVEAWMRDEGIL